jgi:hypothetical protein
MQGREKQREKREVREKEERRAAQGPYPLAEEWLRRRPSPRRIDGRGTARQLLA